MKPSGRKIDDESQIDPRFLDDPVIYNGKARKRRRRLTKQEADEVVESIRTMMILDVNKCDIKRNIAKNWRLDTRSVDRYLTLAKRRNLTHLDQTAEEALTESLGYWSRKKQQAEARVNREAAIEQRANKVLDECDREYEALREKATEANPLTEQLEVIEMRRANATSLREQCRKSQFAAEVVSKDAQREIDRLKGNHAPLKIAKTDRHGNDIPAMTVEERRERLRALGVEPTLRLPQVIDVPARDVTRTTLPAPAISFAPSREKPEPQNVLRLPDVEPRQYGDRDDSDDPDDSDELQ